MPFSNLSAGTERFEPFYRSSTSAKTIIPKILQFVKGFSGEQQLPGFCLTLPLYLFFRQAIFQGSVKPLCNDFSLLGDDGYGAVNSIVPGQKV